MASQEVKPEDIQVPAGMVQAVLQSNCGDVLRDALAWQANNPLVPSDEEAIELGLHPKTQNSYENYAKAVAEEWQRRMWLKKETLPQELLDELRKNVSFGGFTEQLVRRAYAMGKAAK